MATNVPGALAGLVTALKAAELPVLDGPVVTSTPMSESITVGFTSAEDATAVESSTALDGLGPDSNREQFTISNFISVTSGSTGVVTDARNRAYALLAAVDKAIARDKTLQGAVGRAWVSGHTLRQQQAGSGLLVGLNFSVTCDAFTRI